MAFEFDFQSFLWTVWFASIVLLIISAVWASWPVKDDTEFLIELSQSPHAWDKIKWFSFKRG